MKGNSIHCCKTTPLKQIHDLALVEHTNMNNATAFS